MQLKGASSTLIYSYIHCLYQWISCFENQLLPLLIRKAIDEDEHQERQQKEFISPEEPYVQGFHAMALSLIMGVPLAAHRQFDSAPERMCNLLKQ